MDPLSGLTCEDDDEHDESAFPPAEVAAYADTLRREEIIGTADSAADTDASDAGSQIILGPQRKKHRTSGDFLGQNVAAATSINLGGEEKPLMSAPQEGSQASQATTNVVQEEEELFLNEGPLRQKIAATLSKHGLTDISREAVHCLSLGTEKYLQRLLNGAVQMAKERLKTERHQDVSTPDIQNKIVSINQEAQELLPQRNENEEKVNYWRTTGNVAEGGAVDEDYLASNWQLMSEQTQQKHEGLITDFTSQADGSVPRNIQTDYSQLLEEQPKLEEAFRITLDDLLQALEGSSVNFFRTVMALQSAMICNDQREN